MANTYYDSDLTGEQIEQALEAIDGVIVPANNGKVLAINNGKLEARSVQWGGGEPTIESLSVTENGTYTAPSGVDGYSPVTVNVAGGGGSAVVQPLSVTQNGTYNPPSGVDGYAPVTVNVSGGGGDDPFLKYVPYTTVPMVIEYIDSNSFYLEFEVKTGLSTTTVGFIFAPSGIPLKAKLIEVYPSTGFGVPQTGLCSISAAMPDVILRGSGRISYNDHSVINSEYAYLPVEGTSYFYAGVYQAPNNSRYKFLITKNS